MTPDEIRALPYRPCVGIMLINSDGLIFAAQRLDFQSDAWQMPQGGVDKGEAPRAAALRELGEETGVPPEAVEILDQTQNWIPYDLPHDLVPKLWNGRYRGQEQLWFAMRLTGDESLINIETEEPEFSQWQWMQADDLIAKIVPFKAHIYQQVVTEFREYLV